LDRGALSLPGAGGAGGGRDGPGVASPPVAEAAWIGGDIGGDHVRLLSRARRAATADRLASDEEMLVGHATNLRFQQFTRIINYWEQHADPDGADEKAADKVERRDFHLSQSWGGVWFGDLVLDPISGTIFAKELKKIEQELFDDDWAGAKGRLGREPTVGELARTPGQRRADAVVEMAVRSATAPADGRRPEPLFTVFVGWETLKGRICQLSNGTVVAPGALVPWLRSAWLERIVFDSPSRVIDVGVASRLFKGATRRAVEVRNQQCFHPTCDLPGDDCQIDHIVPWSAGGPTEQSNGRCACGFHNRDRQRRRDPNPPDERPPPGPSG
jgi:hypothetical protein